MTSVQQQQGLRKQVFIGRFINLCPIEEHTQTLLAYPGLFLTIGPRASRAP